MGNIPGGAKMQNSIASLTETAIDDFRYSSHCQYLRQNLDDFSVVKSFNSRSAKQVWVKFFYP
jgi:hypothetical protein